MGTRKELLGNEHESKPNEEGNRDLRRRKICASWRTFRVTWLDGGFYTSGIFALRAEITEWIEKRTLE